MIRAQDFLALREYRVFPQMLRPMRDGYARRVLLRMPRKHLPFRQADITRAARGAIAAGFNLARIEITPEGKIVLVASEGEDRVGEKALDNWMAKHARPS